METVKLSQKPERIDGNILCCRKLSINAKRLWAILIDCKGTGRSIEISTQWLADRLSITRQAVSRSVAQLESQGYLKVFRRKQQTSVYHVKQPKPIKQFFLYFHRNNRHSLSDTMVLCYLEVRQGEKDSAWPHLQTIADDLGMSKAQAIRSIRSLESAGLLIVRRVHGGLKQGNRYALTSLFNVSFCYSKTETGVTNRYTDRNTSKDFKNNTIQKKSEEGLSAKPKPETTEQTENYGKKCSMLYRAGVKPGVARDLAKEHTLESVAAAVANAEFVEQQRRKLLRRFNKAAYIVGTLSKARQEGHGVEFNQQAKRAYETFKQHRQQQGRQADFAKSIDAAKMAVV